MFLRCVCVYRVGSVHKHFAGDASFHNKLDALLFAMLLEVGHSESPLQDLEAYNEMVINNCSDQGTREQPSQL